MTSPLVKSPKAVWVDLYSETGIAPGTQVIVQNIGSPDCYLVDNPTQPEIGKTGFNLITEGSFLTSAATPTMLWSYSPLGTDLQIEEA